jgi:hypothetical protein
VQQRRLTPELASILHKPQRSKHLEQNPERKLEHSMKEQTPCDKFINVYICLDIAKNNTSKSLWSRERADRLQA